MQFDADTVGSRPGRRAEICMMAADTMEELGIPCSYVVKVKQPQSADGVMEASV